MQGFEWPALVMVLDFAVCELIQVVYAQRYSLAYFDFETGLEIACVFL